MATSPAIYSLGQLFEPVEEESNLSMLGNTLIRRRYRDIHHEEVKKMSKLFVTGYVDQWLTTPTNPGDQVRLIRSDQPCQVPNAFTADIFRTRHMEHPYLLTHLDFVFVVTGMSGVTACHMLRLATEQYQAQYDVFTELTNSFSVVFTGAILKVDSRKLFGQRAFDARVFRLEKIPYANWDHTAEPGGHPVGAFDIVNTLNEARVTRDGDDGPLLEIGILC